MRRRELMKTCPECGNRYRPDVERCPNDGASLSLPGPPPTHLSAPPTAGPPTARAPEEKKAPRPAPSIDPALLDEPASLREGSSAGAWIGVLFVSLLMLAGYGFASGKLELDELLGRGDATAGARSDGEDGDEESASKQRRRRASKRGRRAAQGDEELTDEVDFVVDDREFGDLIAEGRAEDAAQARAQAAAQAEVVEAPPFEPPPEMWDPSPSYRPSSRYAEPGSNKAGAVTIDLSSGANPAAPLPPATIERVLDVGRLMPCYDEVVQKVPQMRGRVNLSFTVAPDGHVSRVVVTRSKLRSKLVEDCIVRRARGFRFPASQSGQATKFETHFDFTSR